MLSYRERVATATRTIYFYDFDDAPRSNGEKLASNVQATGSDDVALVCYSMDGLVARLAVLEHDVPAVNTVVMLAMPNSGSIQAGQIGLLMQPAVQAGRALLGCRPRKQGILDLTRVPSIFE